MRDADDRTSASPLEYLFPFMRTNVEVPTDGRWREVVA